MKVLTDVESKNTADRYLVNTSKYFLHAQEAENMKDQSDETFAETEQWKEVVGNLQILQHYIKTMNRREIQLFKGEATDGDLSVA